jgi:pyruvate dehydrogenase E2 component (dihydrolipoamide acetyltransferase)
MAVPVNIPKLGMTMTEAKLVEWKAKEGDWVEKGNIVLTIETEKITWEVEAVGSGFLHILVAKDNNAEVGDVVGLLAETREELEGLQKEHPMGEVVKEMPVSISGPAPAQLEKPQEKTFVLASPSARRLAKDLGIDLTLVPGTGPGGRIIEADVTKYHEEGPPPPKITPLALEMARQAGLDLSKIVGTGEGGKITKEDVKRALEPRGQVEVVKPCGSIPFTGMRKRIAQNLHASLQNTAQVTSFVEIDVTEMVLFRDLVREKYKNDEAVRVSYNDIIVLATSRALKQFPIMNSTLRGDEILLHDSVNMGIAVALPDGLIVPVLRDADKKGLLQIAKETRELARKAREKMLTVDDLTGGTFTISNVSMFMVDGSTPILRPSETGILGVGRVKQKPAVYNREISIRSMMFLSLTFDHRVVDGVPAGEFLETVAQYLQNPTLILT